MFETWQDRLKIYKDREAWKDVLREQLFDLCTKMDPDSGLVERLLGQSVLTKRAAENCRAEKLKYDRNRFVVNHILKRPFDDFIKFCVVLCETEQQHLADSFLKRDGTHRCPLDAPNGKTPPDESDATPIQNPVNFNWQCLIKLNLPGLISSIDLDNFNLIPTLVSKSVIPDGFIDKYSNKNESKSSRVNELLNHMMGKSDVHFQSFCDALEETNQGHVVREYLSVSARIWRSLPTLSVLSAPDEIITSRVSPNWKDVLIRCQPELIDAINPDDDLINHLERLQVFNGRCSEECKVKRTDSDKVTFILDVMKTRPDCDFLAFCKALKLTNQEHVVTAHLTLTFENCSVAIQESVDRTEPVDVATGHRDETAERDTPLKDFYQHEGPQHHDPPDGSTGEGDDDTLLAVAVQEESLGTGQETMNIYIREEERGLPILQEPSVLETENRFLVDTQLCDRHAGAFTAENNAVAAATAAAAEDLDPIDQNRPSPITTVTVQRSSEQFYREHRSTSYAMNKPSRGKCIIFNNDSFKRMRGRSGAAVDASSLKTLFEKLHFNVEEIRNATAQDIRSKLNEVSGDPFLENDQCFVLFVLSHGDLQDGRCVVFGSDDEAVELDELCSPFAPAVCRSLQDKPKLIFIQACRGDQYDCTESDAFGDSDRQQPRSYPDFLIGFPTQLGFRAFRDVHFGSWYINALTQVFMTRSHDTNLNGMMNQVAGLASTWLSKTGLASTENRTQFATYTCSFKKDFYFFPGITT